VYKKILSKYSSEKIQEILKLASIVEKEERSTKNKPIVA
jgi:cell division protein YceG involved in septum cleavage